jgi:hypothetical protein
MRTIAVIVFVAALAAWPSAPAADETTSGNLVQSTEVVGERHGIDITQRVRRVDAGLPPGLNQVEIAFPPRTRLNTGAFPRCSIATLQAKGPSACAPGARVGSGIARAQVPFRFPHEFHASLRIFNGTRAKLSNRRQLLAHVRPQAGPQWVLVGRWSGSPRTGLRLTLSPPPVAIPEAVPDSLVRLVLRIGARRGGASFLRAPCPATYGVTARYFDGSVVTSSDRARCG